MMKKYFAKYLPVEGEIKKGSTVLVKDSPILMERDPFDGELPKDSKPVKLFLCSRDLQVGDKGLHWVQDLTDSFTMIEDGIFEGDFTEKFSTDKIEFFKVIGEISPKATWVHQGMEFDEDEIQQEILQLNFPLNSDIDEIEERIKETWKYNIESITKTPSEGVMKVEIKLKTYNIKCKCCDRFSTQNI